MSQERQHVGFPLLALAVLRLRGHRLLAFALCCATLGWLIWLHPVMAFAAAGSIKGSVTVTTSDPNAKPTLLSGASLTLVNRDVPGQTRRTLTDDAGDYLFADLPAATYPLMVETKGLMSVTREVRLPAGETLIVDIRLTATVSESVTVREAEGLLSTAETSTSNIVRAETLKDLPRRAENYQRAVLLTPGAVRSADGLDHLKRIWALVRCTC